MKIKNHKVSKLTMSTNAIKIQDKVSKYILNANRNLLISFGAFFGALGFIIAIEVFVQEQNYKQKENGETQNKKDKQRKSFVANIALLIFVAIILICLYHIYLVYHYQTIINDGEVKYNLEWFLFPIFIIMFTGIPLYMYLEELL